MSDSPYCISKFLINVSYLPYLPFSLIIHSRSIAYWGYFLFFQSYEECPWFPKTDVVRDWLDAATPSMFSSSEQSADAPDMTTVMADGNQQRLRSSDIIKQRFREITETAFEQNQREANPVQTTASIIKAKFGGNNRFL